MFTYKKIVNSSFEIGLELTCEDLDNDHEKCTITITPYLRSTNNTIVKRCTWELLFTVNGNTAYRMGQAIPNATSVLRMEQNEWYQWGYPFKTKLLNNGEKVEFGLQMRCAEAPPRYCPGPDSKTFLTTTLRTGDYAIRPPKPSGVHTSYDETTLILKYLWDKPDCLYTQVYRTWYDAYGNVIKKGLLYILDDGGEVRNKFYGSDVLQHRIKEELPETVAYVKWYVINYSTTGHTATSDMLRFSRTTDNFIWIKVGSDWKRAIPWVKVDGVWQRAVSAYVKVDDTWKRTIM